MAIANGVILCLAFIVGLLSSQVSWSGYGLLGLGVALAIASRNKRWHRVSLLRKPAGMWLVAGLIGLLAHFYVQMRTPTPLPNDISRWMTDTKNESALVTVQGTIQSPPRLTRSQRVQLWLEVNQVSTVIQEGKPTPTSQPVSGRLYTTVPLLQGTGLYPGQAIGVTGRLYEPSGAANPGGFDFRAYLAQQNCFAGLSGRQITLPKETPERSWGWWKIRQRIVRSQVQWLGSPEGPLVSSMVLGSRAVDLPYDIRDQFAKVGLAHVLAASGFQVSLLLGWVLILTRRLRPRVQFVAGAAMLLAYVGLTGIQPSVARAALMGAGALVALVLGRETKSLGTLLMAATVLLLFQPIWVWDLGFQLSFLATLGLLVTVPPLVKRLDWLPPAIASILAVPVAAYIWTIPLQLYEFGVVSPYSVLVNVLVSPLVAVVSTVGIVSAAVALAIPAAGGAIAGLTHYPIQWLLGLVKFFGEMPGSAWATGQIGLVQLALLYGLIGVVWLWPWWRKRWALAAIAAIAAVFIPIWQLQQQLVQVTVLASGRYPVMVIQDQGKVALINSGDDDTARFTVLPFLQQNGINQIDWAIATDPQAMGEGWSQVNQFVAIKQLYSGAKPAAPSSPSSGTLANVRVVTPGSNIQMNSATMQLLQASPTVWQLRFADRRWLLLGDLRQTEQARILEQGRSATPVEVLWWSGRELAPSLLTQLRPKLAIASSNVLSDYTIAQLQNSNIPFFWTGRDGALQWTPQAGFAGRAESDSVEASAL